MISESELERRAASKEGQAPGIRQHLEAWAQDLEYLRQHPLLSERNFIAFARSRGIPVSGVLTGDPADFHRRGWLRSDGKDDSGKLYFHPFRVYTLHEVLARCGVPIAKSSSLRTDELPELVKFAVSHLPSSELIATAASVAEQVTDLAVLLEPIYWPEITNQIQYGMYSSLEEHELRLGEYRKKAAELIKTLDCQFWREQHQSLCRYAGLIDDNHGLYVLLRLADWDKREKLKGSISGALWIRHIAEVVRRAFEDVRGERWPEEDQAFSVWPAGSRTKIYGTERPFDDIVGAKPHVAKEFGLFTGSTVRWYVEGETEFSAINAIVPTRWKFGIEVMNLKGAIASGRDNAALRLEDCLKEDGAVKRFSILSFDCDVPENVKAVRRQVEQGNMVGFVAAHKPDFEFANFAVAELAEVAARLDESHGFPGNSVRIANWEGVNNGHTFGERYVKVSNRRPSTLKGEEWGRALGHYAREHPDRIDNGLERPLLRAVRAALQCLVASYDFQKECYGFDPVTFDPVDRRKSKL